jgi:hypothetical protein
MPSCRQTIIPVELRNPRVRSVAERAGHGTTPTVRGAWDRTMDTIEGTRRFLRAVARDGARDPRPPPYEVQRMGCIVISGARTTVMIIDWRYDIPGWAGAPCYVARPAAPGSRLIRSNVAWSGAPLKYLRRASVNSGCRASTAANSVMQEWNFIASTCPKICSAVEPSTALTSRVHSTSRDPSTGCARYAAASFTCGWRRSALSHSPQSDGLGEHKPQPVAGFPSGAQLGSYAIDHRLLSDDEACEVMGIGAQERSWTAHNTKNGLAYVSASGML